jgi:hypothetical protein
MQLIIDLIQNQVGFVSSSLEKPVNGPVFPLNPRKLFQELKFLNSLNYFSEDWGAFAP